MCVVAKMRVEESRGLSFEQMTTYLNQVQDAQVMTSGALVAGARGGCISITLLEEEYKLATMGLTEALRPMLEEALRGLDEAAELTGEKG